MDYSSMHDENPVGASPWGSSPGSSPRQTRGFSSLDEDDAQQTPFGYEPPSAGNGLSGDATDELVDGGYRRSGASEATAVEHESGESQREVSASEEAGTSPGGHVMSRTERDDVPPETPVKSQEQQRAAEQGQQQQPQPQPQQGQGQGQRQQKQTAPQFRLHAKITGLERTGKKDPILRFDVHTNLPSFRTTQYRDVRRLHSEFVKLAEHLISANPEAIVPAVPPPLTSAGAGTDEDEVRVKALMQRWFNYVCSSEILMRDDEMVLFVESDFGYSPMVKMKQPATGVRRKILKQFAPPPDDTPELAAARPTVKLFYLGTMDAGHKVDKMVKARRGLGLSESDFGVKLGYMNVQEPHPGLANAYRKLGKIIQNVGDLHAAQATAQATTIGDPFQYHSQDAFIVKETLTNRQILIREFLQAQESTRSKLASADRLKASSSVRRDKVDEAIAALDEARQHETYMFKKTTAVTRNLVHEKRKWFTRSAADLRLSVREYVVREIEFERRTLSMLESVRGDIRCIDASGGLSRLGREAHPPIRRPSLAASQGPKGDAWSGVPRRADLGRSLSSSIMASSVPEEAESEAAAAGQRSAAALPGVSEEDDEDKIDARNAASRLATSTF